MVVALTQWRLRAKQQRYLQDLETAIIGGMIQSADLIMAISLTLRIRLECRWIARL